MVAASIEAVAAAAKNVASLMLDYETATAVGGDSGYLDALDRIAGEFEIESIAKFSDSPRQRHLIFGQYVDYPEGGTWNDHVEACDVDDATFQAKFTMAGNCGQVGPVLVKDYPKFADLMADQSIIECDLEIVTKDEALDLVKKFIVAGTGMLRAYGDCGSPFQTKAADALAAAIKEAQAALQMTSAPATTA